MALRGFEQFAAALAKAWDDGRPNTFAALEEGIVPGGGVALLRSGKDVDELIKKLEGDE